MPKDYDPSYLTWKMEDLPILPNHMGLKVISKTRPQFHAIEQLAKRKDVKELIIATDAGCESERVARWTIEKCIGKNLFRGCGFPHKPIVHEKTSNIQKQ